MSGIEIVLTIVLWLAPGNSPSTHVQESPGRLMDWYAARSIIVKVERVYTRTLPVDPCTDMYWWADQVAMEKDSAGRHYVYIVDTKCPVWQDGVRSYDGAAYVGGDLAVLSTLAGLNERLVHEVGHLLGAYDNYGGYDIMSCNMGQAYIDGTISLESWLQMGGKPPNWSAYLPMSMGGYSDGVIHAQGASRP